MVRLFLSRGAMPVRNSYGSNDDAPIPYRSTPLSSLMPLLFTRATVKGHACRDSLKGAPFSFQGFPSQLLRLKLSTVWCLIPTLTLIHQMSGIIRMNNRMPPRYTTTKTVNVNDIGNRTADSGAVFVSRSLTPVNQSVMVRTTLPYLYFSMRRPWHPRFPRPLA